VVAAILPLSAAGCSGAAAAPHFESLTGRVAACHAETGELLVEADARPLPNSPAGASIVHCVLTRSSEVYIDDVLSPLTAIARHDRVELIGYRTSAIDAGALVVSLARIARERPAAPTPEPLYRVAPHEPQPGGT
jgi:hypothetical protein